MVSLPIMEEAGGEGLLVCHMREHQHRPFLPAEAEGVCSLAVGHGVGERAFAHFGLHNHVGDGAALQVFHGARHFQRLPKGGGGTEDAC